jgi:lipopolysaccharide transport system permease protein
MSTAPPTSVAMRHDPGIVARFKELYARRQTVRFLVRSNLKADHRDKLLGRLWSLLDPLLFMLVYLVVFGFLFGQARRGTAGMVEFIVYLLCGVLSWRFFDGAVVQATRCIRGNRGLIHEIKFPKSVFPLSICLSRLSDFLWGLIVLLGIVLIARFEYVNLNILWLPVIVLLQLVFTLGLALFVAVLGAFFADTTNIVAVMMRLWFYASPMFYRVAKSDGGLIPDRYVPYYMLNPIACLFELYRDCLMNGRPPDTGHLLYLTGLAVILVVGGFSVFTRAEGRFAKYI